MQDIKQNQIIYKKEAQNLKDKQVQINNQINEINKQRDIKTKENNQIIEVTTQIKKENIEIKERLKQIIKKMSR